MNKQLRSYLSEIVQTLKERQQSHKQAFNEPVESYDGKPPEPFDPVEYEKESLEIMAQLSRSQDFLTLDKDICARCYVFTGKERALANVDSNSRRIDKLRCGVCGMEFGIPA